MKLEHFYLISILLVFAQTTSAGENLPNADRKVAMLRGPRPVSDLFRNIQRDVTKTEMNQKIDIFKSYGCEHMVSLANEAASPILLWCSSGDEDIKEVHVIPDESFAFTLRPKRNGKSVFQCVLNYEEKWATFAVYNEDELYSAPREKSHVYRYTVQEDGVYFNDKHKIKAFFTAFDYSTDDYYDYYNGNYPSSDDEAQIPKKIPHRFNMTQRNLPKKRNLGQAPSRILDSFNTIRANLSSKANFPHAPETTLDRFYIIRANLSKEDLRTEIDYFASYDCERMVVLSNDASDPFRLWCSSSDDNIREETVSTGRSFSFSFKRKQNGNSRFQCVLDYKGKWATFDVFNGTDPCSCEQQTRNVYQYSIRNYGVYTEGNIKIKSLFNGRNQYTLWESYNDYNEMPYGKLMTGFVDGPGDCTTVPSEVNDKSAAVTVCNSQCVVAYEHIKCDGQRQTIQAYSGCRHVKLWNGLYKELSSVKGC